MKCDGCTLCCKLFDIDWMDAPPNVDCKHCINGKGCTIQKTKPTKCREFECSYSQSPNAPIHLRPDNCKVIFEKRSDQLFIGTLDARFELTDSAKDQVSSFINQGYSVILGATDYRKPKILIAPGHNEDEIYKQWRHTEQI